MTVGSTPSWQAWNGDGSTVTFDITAFEYQQTADVTLILRDAAGAETTWVEGTQYTLSLLTDSPPSRITVKTTPTDYTPASGEKLFAIRAVVETQATDLAVGGALQADSIETALDKAVMLIQQLTRKIGRAALLATTTPTSGLVLPEPEADKLLGWNAGATNIENKAQSTGGGGVTDHGALTGLADDDHTQYQLRTEKAVANGYAGLDGSGKVPSAQLPADAVSSVFGRTGAVVAVAADRDGLAQDMQDAVLTRPNIKDYALTKNTATTHTGSVAISHADGNVYVDTSVTGNLTLDVSNWPASDLGKIDVWLKSDAIGGWTITLTGFTWATTAAAALTASKWTRFTLESPDGGTTKFASLIWEGK